MKRIFKYSVLALAVSLAAVAQAASVSWVQVQSAAATGDKTPGLAALPSYSAYCLSTSDAKDIFGSTTVSAISASLKKNYKDGKAAVAADGTALTIGNYGAGQYDFSSYPSPLAGKDYLAILFYEDADSSDYEFRVFGADSAMSEEGQIVYDDTEEVGTVGDWEQAAVPEPTSGILLLIGLAGIALKRRR